MKSKLTIAIALSALLVASCSSASAKLADAEARIAELEAELFAATLTTVPAIVTVGGTMTLSMDDIVLPVRTDCFGAGGFDDIAAGADVVVLDGSGNTIGTSRLEPGEEMTDVKVVIGDDPNRFILRDFCVFAFTIEDVTADADFYTIEVANREGPTYSNSDMIAQEWTVALTLG